MSDQRMKWNVKINPVNLFLCLTVGKEKKRQHQRIWHDLMLVLYIYSFKGLQSQIAQLTFLNTCDLFQSHARLSLNSFSSQYKVNT